MIKVRPTRAIRPVPAHERAVAARIDRLPAVDVDRLAQALLAMARRRIDNRGAAEARRHA